MPSNAWRRTAGLLPHAALATLGSEYPRPSPHIIGTWSNEVIGAEIGGILSTNSSSGTYTTGSTAIALPLCLAHPFLVRKVWWFNGTTATTDSADVGVYTEAGSRLVSGGGTAISGASGLQEVDVTDTPLRPGRYWLCYVQNGTTATPVRWALGSAPLGRAIGIAQMGTAYPLPTTLTPAALTMTALPLFGIASRTLAA